MLILILNEFDTRIRKEVDKSVKLNCNLRLISNLISELLLLVR